MTRPGQQHADAAAFCAAEWPQLVRALSLYVGDPFVAEELAQEALVLRHVLDLSASETAVRMGISPDAVRSLTRRATATLRDQLGEHTPIGTREGHDA